jgi:anti-sigma factor ChrR (cupin superfamily)
MGASAVEQDTGGSSMSSAQKVGFMALNASKLEWADDTDVLALPKGLKVKVLMTDKERNLTALLVKFPAGYHEPKHVHNGTHAATVLEGKQIVNGVTLERGDFCYGPAGEEHGPFDYPEGCVVFGVFQGDTVHEYDDKH